MDSYAEFLARKAQHGAASGFAPVWLPDFLFDFQQELVDWALRQGRALIAADCGLGKSPMELVWAENVVRTTGKPVLLLTPLAVGAQMLREAEKFGVEAHRSGDGAAKPGVTIANYERLHHFTPSDFGGVVCDESSAIKAFDGQRRAIVTEFLRTVPYRLLATATAAPNDYIELGTASEALGGLGYTDMLTRFFKNDQNTVKPMVYRHRGQDFAALAERAKWRFKGHAEEPFWRWVCSWARALRRPSDLGYDNARFALPTLTEQETRIASRTTADGYLFDLPPVGLQEERAMRRRTLTERCEAVAGLVADTGESAVVWCHLNDEGDLLEDLIPDAQQVSGADSDETKEETFEAFRLGQTRVLVIKPKIGAWGLNWQFCAHVVYFPTYSYEQYYQAVRRCWRFGQIRPVVVDLVTTDGDNKIAAALKRKAEAADRMFSRLVEHMHDALRMSGDRSFPVPPEIPAWL